MQLSGSTYQNPRIASSQFPKQTNAPQYPTSSRKSWLQSHAEGKKPPLTPVTYQHLFTTKNRKPHNLFPIAAKCESRGWVRGDSMGMATFVFVGRSHGSSTTPMAMAMTIASHACGIPHSFLQYEFFIRSGG